MLLTKNDKMMIKLLLDRAERLYQKKVDYIFQRSDDFCECDEHELEKIDEILSFYGLDDFDNGEEYLLWLERQPEEII